MKDLIQRAVDWVFGYDFFLSYSHDDGVYYPNKLKHRLEKLGFRVFLDQTEYVAGIDLRRETRRQVVKSRKIIIIGRARALRSKWVKREIDISLSSGKTPIIVDINGAVTGARPDAPVAALALASDWLRLDEVVPDPDGEPSDYTVAELVRAFKYTRQESKRLRVFASAAGVFATLALGAGLAAIAASSQKAAAERNFSMAKEAADGLVVDIARKLRHKGLSVEMVHNILERSHSTFDSLLKNDPSNMALQRSKATMLGEFAVTYLAAGDPEASMNAAQAAVQLSESIARRQECDLSVQKDLAQNLSRLADAETERGNLETARQHHERALAIRKKILSSSPTKLEAARDVTISLMRLGEIDETLGQFQNAIHLFEQASELRKPLVNERPEWQRDLTVAYMKLGDAKLSLVDTSGARAAFDEAIRNARNLYRSDDTNTQRDLAVALQRQGNLGLSTNDSSLAKRAYLECLSMFIKLSQLDDKNFEWSKDIAISRFKLGQAEALAKNIPKARDYLQDALRTRRDLLRESPKDHQLQTDIAENLMELEKVSLPMERELLLREARTLLAKLKNENQTGVEQDAWLDLLNQKLAQLPNKHNRKPLRPPQ